MAKPIFTKKDRVRCCKLFAEQVRQTFGVDISAISEHKELRTASTALATVETKHGPMRLCLSVSPRLIHLYQQFENRPGDDLPFRDLLNPYSFKYNYWIGPMEYGPYAVACFLGMWRDLHRQLLAA